MATINTRAEPTGDDSDHDRKYRAPALEKGLDILELLARHGAPMTTSQMAATLGRSVSELFRMVLALEFRGYIEASPDGRDGWLDYFLAAVPDTIPVAVEFRHDSWHTDAVFDLLERHRAAYVVMSGAGLPCILRATAGFVYVRFHGPDHQYLYGGSYDDAAMAWWADRIAEWRASGRTVFGYFNNDAGGNAFRNAQTLRHLLRQRGG